MCVSPSFVWHSVGSKWDQVPVPCEKCWQCRENKINDFVGRGLCEASTSTAVFYATLTYAPRGDFSERVITPPHFQDAIRALRKRGHVLRYMGSGEYGERKGRAHFHAVLFFKGPRSSIPDFPHSNNFHADWWPHGHIYGEWLDGMDNYKPVRYVCKYCIKQFEGNESQSWFTLSKKPVLGYEFLEARAARYIDAGILPRSFNYNPPGGKPGIDYLLTGAARRDFLQIIVEGLRSRGLLPEDHFSWSNPYTQASDWVKGAIARHDDRQRQIYLASAYSEPFAHHVAVGKQYLGTLEALDRRRPTVEQVELSMFLEQGRANMLARAFENGLQPKAADKERKCSRAGR